MAENSKIIILPSRDKLINDILEYNMSLSLLSNFSRIETNTYQLNQGENLIMSIGEDDNLSDAIEHISNQKLYEKLAIFHIGKLSNENIIKFIESRDIPTIGYNDNLWLPTQKDNYSFNDVIINGINNVIQGNSFNDVFNVLTQDWQEVFNDTVKNDKMMAIFANMNRIALTYNGNMNWKITKPIEIIYTQKVESYPQNIKVHLINITPAFIDWLNEDPTRISQLSPDQFEDLIADRFENMGMNVHKTGTTYTSDGGIDLLATPKSSPFPFLLATQIKHSKVGNLVGPNVVREFLGSITPLPVDIGIVVTNTQFTPDARWIADNNQKIIRLRDFSDLKLWLSNEFSDQTFWKDIPDFIEIAPGFIMPIPRSFS